MTLAEFEAFFRGFRRFHSDDTPEAPSADAWRQALADEALRTGR